MMREKWWLRRSGDGRHRGGVQGQLVASVFFWCAILYYTRAAHANSFTVQEVTLDSWAIPEEFMSPEVQYTIATHWGSAVQNLQRGQVRESPTYFLDCLADGDYFRMVADPLCLLHWMGSLERSDVQSVSAIEPVVTEQDIAEGVTPDKRHENGGVHMHFVRGNSSVVSQGYWKPCYGNAASYESYLAEIMAFHLDKVLGFYRVLPAVPRRFKQSDLMQLAVEAQNAGLQDDAVWAMKSILRHCGDADGEEIEGAMIGWAPFPLHQILKTKEREGVVAAFGIDVDRNPERVAHWQKYEFNVTSSSPPEDRIYPLQSVNFHMFQGVTGYIGKYAHNVYSTFERCGSVEKNRGPLLYLDNDRSRLTFQALGHFAELHSITDHPLTKLCKFPKTVGTRLRMLSPLNTQYHNAGEIMQQVLGLYGDRGVLGNGMLMSTSEAANLDSNVEAYARIIELCIEKHGESSVLVEEPWVRNYFTYHTLDVDAALLQERPAIRHRSIEQVEEMMQCPDEQESGWGVWMWPWSAVTVLVLALLALAVAVGCGVLFRRWRARRRARLHGAGSELGAEPLEPLAVELQELEMQNEIEDAMMEVTDEL
eukprot:TRINITY_DN4113_c0_g1_i1.p1 TRINITY_DN4113_c0_g1~~TRINITY_DN4113_c0_g1_i1.p1  ORF type:complete len:594 (+),score=144.93 TRINITY_DN4113_c0_g1_i1:243-2024(+)